MPMFVVSYRARGLMTGWIALTMAVHAPSRNEAKDKAGDILARQCKVGAWFVDWFVQTAEQVA